MVTSLEDLGLMWPTDGMKEIEGIPTHWNRRTLELAWLDRVNVTRLISPKGRTPKWISGFRLAVNVTTRTSMG